MGKARVNKARMIKMYMAGAHVEDIAKEVGCCHTHVWRVMAQLGIHRPHAKPQIHKRQPKPKPKPKPKPVEPMYREIPKHKASVFTVDQNEAELKRQRLSWEKAHPKPWYLGKR